jgi:general secretion pathway protein A
MTPAHREALAGLMYAVLARKGLAVLTGEAGTGKTLLLAAAMAAVPAPAASFSVVLSPTLDNREFLEMVLLGFGIEDIPATKPRRLVQLLEFLRITDAAGKAAVLVIDEAHRLSPELLEEVRLLTNLERPESKLLQILMAGQPEIDVFLNDWGLRQMKQRIACRFSIQPLAAGEVAAYVHYRWSRAGGYGPAPFATAALTHVAAHSGGIPRIVNALCDGALLLAFSETRREVWPEDVLEAAKDLAVWTSRQDHSFSAAEAVRATGV